MAPTWPLTLRDGDLEVRTLRRREVWAMERLRAAEDDWLAPWDATDPDRPRWRPHTAVHRRWADRAGREGTALALVIVVDGNIVGQVSASPILYGSQRTASVGYWVSRRVAGRGIAPRAVALLIDHLFAELGMHRIEVTIRPENAASLRVAQKLGLRDEGLRRGAVHVDGAWRDHRVFAMTAEEIATDEAGRGMLARLRRQASDGGRH